ncbi:MAG TPA: SlyX family protein [Kofleriaceae bacterium]
MPTQTNEELADNVIDLEVKLAYQERLIRELDQLVREFGTRLDTQQRELDQLKQTLRSGEVPQGPATEKPPHY